MTIEQIIYTTIEFNPVKNIGIDAEDYFVECMNELRNNIEFELAIEPVFKLLEKFPSVNFGSPGPIVHSLECFKGTYENYLFQSLERKPTPLTVWMFNRIINAESKVSEKQKLIFRLKSLLSNPLIEKETIDTINDFLDYQTKTTS
jgi:hypothetical protein